MILQSVNKKEALSIMKMAIAESDRRMCRSQDLHYYAFPKVFATSQGPFASNGSLGGSTVTTFTIEVWHNTVFDLALFFCQDKALSLVKNFSKRNIETDYVQENILISCGIIID